ncbi:Endoglucanase C [Thermoflexales bacterium]|nr:Endoglucanase C [Thermoflexales bacterium]
MHSLNRTRTSAWITSVVVVLALLASVIGVNRPVLAAPACQVTYTPNTWNSGFTAEIKITNNTSTPVQGWTLTWSYANGQQVTSAWNATVVQTGANVSASNVASHWNGTIGANGGSASFGVQGTHGGTNTSPTVFALNGVTCGEEGPDTQAPTVPTNLASPSQTTTSINLTWTASTDNVGVTGYDIYRGTTLAGSSATTSFSDTGLTADTLYSYTVRAKDAAGNVSVASAALSVRTRAAVDTQPPTVPTNLASPSQTTTSINLSWTASTDNVGVTGYDIYRGTTLAGSSATTSFVDSGLTPDTLYSYTVRAKDAAGNVSAASVALSVRTQAGGGGSCAVAYTIVNQWGTGFQADVKITNNGTAAIAGWTLTWAYANGQQVTSAWNATVSQAGANVSASNVASHWNGTIGANGGSVSFGFQGTHNGTNTNPTVFAVNGVTCGSGPDTQAPTVPTNLTSPAQTTTSINLAWTASTDNVGVTGYDVYRNGTLVGSSATTSFVNTGLTANTLYTYTVRAKDAAGNVSAASAALGVRTLASSDTQAPTVPTDLASPAQSSTSVTLAWTASTDNVGVTAYDIYRSGTLVGSSATTSFVNTGLTASTTYTYTVRARDAAGNVSAASAALAVTTTASTGGRFRVDAQGRITRYGVPIQIRGGSWFGLQGRYEPASDSANPRGAPMEQYMGNVFWAPSGRTYDQDIAEIKAMGINVVRLPLVHQTLDATDPQGTNFLKNHESVRIANSRLALETIIKKLDAAGIYVLLDIHSCSNYVDWRKGRLDARPPYVDATRDNYDFKREDSSCAATNNPSSVTRIQAYNETLWLQDLRTIAGFETSLGVSNIIGIDIFNEPWDYTWAEWKTLTEHAYAAINEVNPNTLIFMQGISASAGNQDGSPTTITQSPHGSSGIDPNWGENLFEAATNPPAIPRDRLVFSPHAYGPSVFVGKQFMDPAQPQCTGLEGDAAGDAQCNIVINPTLLEQGWDEHFGYLKALGYAVVIGEFGGNWDWPLGAASLRDQNRFGYLTDKTVDAQWQTAFVNYLISRGITDTIYWSINPESGDTGGLYTTPYRAGTNESGWGTWGALDTRKIDLLGLIWDN